MSTVPHIGPTVRTTRTLHQHAQAAAAHSTTSAERELQQAIDCARHAPMFVGPEPLTATRLPAPWSRAIAMAAASAAIAAATVLGALALTGRLP